MRSWITGLGSAQRSRVARSWLCGLNSAPPEASMDAADAIRSMGMGQLKQFQVRQSY
jgi:hypothetical protein